MATFEVTTSYRFNCGEHYCDCGGTHYAESREEADRGARGGYESVMEVYDVQSNDGVIAECYTLDNARRIRNLLNKDRNRP